MPCSEVGDKVIETKVIERNEDDSDFTYADAENDMEAEYQSFECVYPVAYWRSKNIIFFRVPRDSKHIKIGLTLRAKETASLFISYEQLVSRRLGIYELILNLHPGQVCVFLATAGYASRATYTLRMLHNM
jgi:hypothetical protein